MFVILHLVICDDEAAFVSHLTELVERYAEESGEKIKITAYYDGMELIEKYDPSTDLIFLDIQMKLLDGLHTAERIRQMDQKVGLIFLTTLTQYGLEGYNYQAANYIIKPIKYIRLKTELNRFLERRRSVETPSIIVRNDTRKYKVQLKELSYIETFNRKLLLHTNQEKIISYKTMKEMESELAENGFARCHTSYLVNLFYVKGVKRLELELITGETIPISQPKRKSFMEQLTGYWGERI